MRTALVALALALMGCGAAAPKAPILTAVDDARKSPAVLEAERRAPQAHAHAEQLRERAEEASQAGDTASAQILGEHALAAYEHAVILSRLAAAEVRRGEAEARLAQAEKQLHALDEQQKRVLAETEQLELQARVIRDTLPLPSNAPSSPERERARLEAARSLALQARLLCASARLLEATRSSLPALFKELDALDERLTKGASATLDEATKLRSQCLSELSQVRRPKTLAAPAAGLSDQLLDALSNASYEPTRDDRGVVVTLRGVYAGGETLSDTAEKALGSLGRVAATHPDFPVLVVLHTAGPNDRSRDARRLEIAADALRKGGAARVETAFAGAAAPAISPRRPGARERNERLEVVFVSPSST